MKMIIAKHGENFVVTSKKNYYSYVQNAHEIQRLPVDEWTPEEIISYYCQYFGSKEEDFTII